MVCTGAEIAARCTRASQRLDARSSSGQVLRVYTYTWYTWYTQAPKSPPEPLPANTYTWYVKNVRQSSFLTPPSAKRQAPFSILSPLWFLPRSDFITWCLSALSTSTPLYYYYYIFIYLSIYLSNKIIIVDWHWQTGDDMWHAEPSPESEEKREWKMLLGAWRLAVSDSRYKKLKMITKYAELADRLIVLKKSWKNLQKTVFFFSPLFGMECLRKEKQKRGLSSRGFVFLEIKSHEIAWNRTKFTLPNAPIRSAEPMHESRISFLQRE